MSFRYILRILLAACTEERAPLPVPRSHMEAEAQARGAGIVVCAPVSGNGKGAASSRRRRAQMDRHPPFGMCHSAAQITMSASFAARGIDFSGQGKWHHLPIVRAGGTSIRKSPRVSPLSFLLRYMCIQIRS